jgi:hypothetical protein
VDARDKRGHDNRGDKPGHNETSMAGAFAFGRPQILGVKRLSHEIKRLAEFAQR